MFGELLSIAKNIATKTIDGTKDAALVSLKSAIASEHQNFVRVGVDAVRGIGGWMKNLDANNTGPDDFVGSLVVGAADAIERSTEPQGPPQREAKP